MFYVLLAMMGAGFTITGGLVVWLDKRQKSVRRKDRKDYGGNSGSPMIQLITSTGAKPSECDFPT
jgi:hypothetical protein